LSLLKGFLLARSQYNVFKAKQTFFKDKFLTFIFTENKQYIQKLINMPCAIKTCTNNIIIMGVPSKRLSRCESTC